MDEEAIQARIDAAVAAALEAAAAAAPHLFLLESQLPELDQLPLATTLLVPRLKPKTVSSTMEPATV
jgi:hypothetical protein